MRLTDTLTGRLRDLEPREPGKVSIYACGPTVYDVPHLGHARTALTYDVLVRYLRWRGHEVTLVSNITDIDDNIINRAAETGTTEPELAARFADVYIDQLRIFGIADPDHRPRATQYVEQMIAVIGELVDDGKAYVVEGRGVYFDVSAFDGYGALCHRVADDLREQARARVAVDDLKEDPLDFALWKAAKPGEPTWDSPWGPGRPGWHIECVAMSLDILGDDFDIHGGGSDLAFPHHENERAEAEAAGHRFARHWVHSAMLNVDGEKMSKSLGNFRNLGDALDAYGPRPLRLAMLQAHYLTVMELSDAAMAGATGGIDRLDAFARRMAAAGVEPADHSDAAAVDAFVAAMDTDLGTPDALAVIFDQVSAGNAALDAGDHDAAAVASATVAELCGVLGIVGAAEREAGEDDAEIDELLAQRQQARADRDFATADAIRDTLAERGIEIEDTPTGPIWRRR
ncbi:MAG: cysteine--tRNA ligase [Acidimicrobiales bacterium]